MAKCLFDSCCGCVSLYEGTKTLAIIVVILKLARLVEACFLMFMSVLLHYYVRRVDISSEIMYAMPVVSAVVIIVQLVFLVMFTVKLFKNRIITIGQLYTANAIFFGIECVALVIFLISMACDIDIPPEMSIGFAVGDGFATVLNLYFILLLRSCIAEENENLPPLTFTKDHDTVTVPFRRLLSNK